MKGSELLESIWAGTVVACDASFASPLARVLDALLVVPLVALVSSEGRHDPAVMVESAELLPDATLGDVLTEELGIYVPRDAVVLIEPAEMACATEVSGAVLGRALGNILTSMASGPEDSAMWIPAATAAVGNVSGRNCSR